MVDFWTLAYSWFENISLQSSNLPLEAFFIAYLNKLNNKSFHVILMIWLIIIFIILVIVFLSFITSYPLFSMTKYLPISKKFYL